MNFIRSPFARQLRGLCLAASFVLGMGAAFAAPGAHGPGGEHLDAKTTSTTGAAMPRLEAKSEGFELVARLQPGELSILIDRYETNEPVLGAQLDVESGPLKATAAFRAESGDYVVTDVALLRALASPGEHALVFTLLAGKESDLLDGTLVSAGGVTTAHGHADDDGHSHEPTLRRAAWASAGVLALGLLGLVVWWRQRRRERMTSAAGAQA